MKILGSRQLPCGHGDIRVTERDLRIVDKYGHGLRICVKCRDAFYFRLAPSAEAKRITGDDVVRIEWMGSFR